MAFYGVHEKTRKVPNLITFKYCKLNTTFAFVFNRNPLQFAVATWRDAGDSTSLSIVHTPRVHDDKKHIDPAFGCYRLFAHEFSPLSLVYQQCPCPLTEICRCLVCKTFLSKQRKKKKTQRSVIGHLRLFLSFSHSSLYRSNHVTCSSDASATVHDHWRSSRMACPGVTSVGK